MNNLFAIIFYLKQKFTTIVYLIYDIIQYNDVKIDRILFK